MRPYDAVFLDAQGTLLQCHPSVAGIYTTAYRLCGQAIPQSSVAAALSDAWLEYRQATAGQKQYDTSDEITRQWWDEFNTGIFYRLGAQGDVGLFTETLWDLFGRSEHWRLFPEVDEVLVELRQRGYQLAIVSNWDSRLFPICEGLGLTPQLNFILASGPAGVEKPDPQNLQMALSQAAVSPNRAIHVGDDYEADLEGARGASIAALLLDRDGNYPGNPASIRSLRELLAILP